MDSLLLCSKSTMLILIITYNYQCSLAKAVILICNGSHLSIAYIAFTG